MNTPALRPWLRWLLGGAVASSALALWWPDGVSRAVARIEQAGDAPALSTAPRPDEPATAQSLPEHLPTALLDKAAADPFIDVQPPAPPPPKPFVGPIYEPPPPRPAPPALNYRYLGQMTAPSGKTLVYLSKPDKDISVEVGTRLDEGYTVQAITREGVHLHYPALDARVVIAIPPGRDSASP